MAAPEGNEFWKQRAKHGRDKIFSSPEVLLESAYEYFTWIDENPLTAQNWVGKDGDEVTKKLGRPYTVLGLCVFLDIEEHTFRNYGTKPEYKDFFPVYTRIMQIIRNQKFEGASVGIFNHAIIARDLGLVDKVQEDGTKKVIIEIEYGAKNKDKAE